MPKPPLFTSTQRGLTASLIASLLAGCAPGAAVTRSAPRAAVASVAPRPTEPVRVVDAGVTARLTGRVKLLSDNGASVISNNSSGLIANNGGSVIANNSGNLISNNGSSVLSAHFGVLAATAMPESALADAQIDVLDAQGHLLLDASQKPITTTSDATGNYKLDATLPDQDLILHVRLFPKQGAKGELSAIRPRAAAGQTQSIDLDLASSLSAHYVVEAIAANQQSVLDRLPGKEAAALHDAFEAARVLLPAKAPSYLPEDLLATARDLEAKAPQVHEQLQHIKALLLAGQANLGTGRAATDVALASPAGVVEDGAGGFFISESTGRIRRVDASGKISVFADRKGLPLVSPNTLLRLPDGALLVADALAGTVRKVLPDGTVTAFAGGTGKSLEVPANQVALVRPLGLALAPDGSIYISEAPLESQAVGRLLRVDPQGILHAVPPPPLRYGTPRMTSLAIAPDGTLYVLDRGDECIHRRAPDGTWTVLTGDEPLRYASRLLLAPDGALFYTLTDDGLIKRLAPDGSISTYAGNGITGSSPDGTPALQAALTTPSGLCLAADGTLYVTLPGSGLVQAIAPGKDHPVRTLAGTTSVLQVGNGTAIAISSPLGVAVDAQGRVVISEATGNTIKRLENGTLSVIAGSKIGPADDADALKATFRNPAGIAYDGPVLYVADSGNKVLRKVDAAGHVTTALGPGTDLVPAATLPAAQTPLSNPLGVAIGPDHLPYVLDTQANRVWRLRPDGQSELIVGLNATRAGGYSGDNGPALTAELNVPYSLAFSPAGDLYVGDSGNGVVRKITGLGKGETPKISTFAGMATGQVIQAALAGPLPSDEGKPASAGTFWTLGPIAFDAKGTLYVGEGGSAELGLVVPAIAIALGDHLPNVGARIRAIGADGVIHTVAGDGGKAMNSPETDDYLSKPVGLAVDGQGRLVIADSGTNQLKLLPLP